MMELTPDQKMQRSMYLAVSQLHLAAEMKRSRMESYGKADSNDKNFEYDKTDIFPKPNAEMNNDLQNQILGIGNNLQPSKLFKPRKPDRVWTPGSLKPNYDTYNWKERDLNQLCLPVSVFQPGKTCDIMSAVQNTMETFYVHEEDKAIAKSIAERPEEDAFDGICTTGFAIDGIPFTQPQLQPMLLKRSFDILSRLPCHSQLDINPKASESCPKFRITYTVYDEEVHGYGFTKEQAMNDGTMKLQYMFQHALDCHDYDVAFWHPLPSPLQLGKRAKAENTLMNLVRCKIDDGKINIKELCPRLFQASCTVEGLLIEAQAYSKKIARKRLFLFLMLLMPNQLAKVDVSEWLGDGASMVPDAKWGLTESQRGQKRGPGLYDIELPPKKKFKETEMITEDEGEIRNKIEKHVTSYTTMIDGTGFPINIYNKKSLHFFLSHRCQNRHKFNKIDKSITDKITTVLELPDGTDYSGSGKTLEMAKHMALLKAVKESTILKQKEPMSTHGVCSYGLLQDLCTNIRVHCMASQDNSVWTCEIEGLKKKPLEATYNEIKITKTDFTKKGAQRLAALQYLQQFNEATRKAWLCAVDIAKEKLQKSDGIDKAKLVNEVFQRVGQKKPSKNESGVINFEIYGHKSEIKSTNEQSKDDELICGDIRENFSYLLQKYEVCPIKLLTKKLNMNIGMKELRHEMTKWHIEHFDSEMKYFRISLTLPSNDRFIGESFNLKNAQKNAAYNCLYNHPVLKLGENLEQHKDYWNQFVVTVTKLPCEFSCEVISGVEDCPKTLYCRVKLSCYQKGSDQQNKLFESTAAGISKMHAQNRAAQKLMEEPTYRGKSALQCVQERKLQVVYTVEPRQESDVMHKCTLKFRSEKDGPEQEFQAEGLTAKLSKMKAAEKLLRQIFGPDPTKKMDREITSIKMIKPVNHNGEHDPVLPPLALARGNKLSEEEVQPDLNEEQKKRYDLATERARKRQEKMELDAKTEPMDCI